VYDNLHIHTKLQINKPLFYFTLKKIENGLYLEVYGEYFFFLILPKEGAQLFQIHQQETELQINMDVCILHIAL